MSPSLPRCLYQLNACAILFTSTGCLLICDSRGGSDPAATTVLCWAVVLGCVEWIRESTSEIHNQPILYQHMFAVKQLQHQRFYLVESASPHGYSRQLWERKRFLGKTQHVRSTAAAQRYPDARTVCLSSQEASVSRENRLLELDLAARQLEPGEVQKQGFVVLSHSHLTPVSGS